VGVGALIGCADPLSRLDDGWRHRRHDYNIGAPGGEGSAWERIDLEGAVLAFRRGGSDSMSLQSLCGRPVADPALMARHLVIGLGGRERTLVRAGPVVVDGRNGWTQTFALRRDEEHLQVKTVTLVVGDCTFDWALVSAGDFARAERDFDTWWSTFRLDARPGEEPGG
jgi:hypothetical protein